MDKPHDQRDPNHDSGDTASTSPPRESAAAGPLLPQSPPPGHATLEQVKSLAEDGIPVAPLPLPVTPPNQVN